MSPVRGPVLVHAIVNGSSLGWHRRAAAVGRVERVAHSAAGISPVSSKRHPEQCLGRLVVEQESPSESMTNIGIERCPASSRIRIISIGCVIDASRYSAGWAW